ncbi:hypothetical protein [Curtobacterium sp. VKM Ac-1393]|uniref:hypothetical protein n=1 Tax=Curtobacterium sp. VKM Ac-1393 TaxID=2783814 RepID=UPI00188C9874|nr:hypothetical protein [Curtobacterium sp. VKM Ac-1393]MBF4608569.1 hypothetical protein [Curtobacterium sp. VKM Ac-1393]
MAQRGPLRPTARIEEAIGFVGMFGILFLGATVFCEVTGRPALGWALTLLVCVLGVVALDRWRVRVLRRQAEVDGVGATPAIAPVRTARGDDTRRRPRPSADGRVHQHSGWDELAPAGRRAPHGVRRTAAAVAHPTPGTAADRPAGVTHRTDG